MINTSTTYNQLSNITSNINDLTSQIAYGKKTLNSQELNKSLEIKESIFQKDEIINQIETFKENTNQGFIYSIFLITILFIYKFNHYISLSVL